MQNEERNDKMVLPLKKSRGLPHRGGQSGFTLIEIMIAITVFAVGVLATASMQTTASGGNSKARYISEATSWASDRVEILMALDYGDANLTAGPHTPAVDPPNYTVTWNVTVNSPIPNIKTVSVSVAHNLLQRAVTVQFFKIDI